MGRKYQQGWFNVRNKGKYIGDHSKVYFRSSWELQMFIWADRNEKVVGWNSEEVIVKYINPFDGKYHRYFTDMYVEMLVDGKVEKKLWEIKPLAEMKPPKKPKRVTKGYMKRLETYLINQAKWKAAYKYSEERDISFSIITEKELGIK